MGTGMAASCKSSYPRVHKLARVQYYLCTCAAKSSLLNLSPVSAAHYIQGSSSSLSHASAEASAVTSLA